VSQQLNSMADGADSGVASDVVRQAASRVSDVAGWLENREPAELLEDVKRFARRQPGLFIAIAAGAGFVAGRLTKALVANAHDDSGSSAGYTGTTTVDYGYGSTGSGYASGAGLAGGYTGGSYSDAPVGSATAPFVAPAGDPVVDEALGYDELGTDINGTPRGDAGGRL
jgi:hypothetical protein